MKLKKLLALILSVLTVAAALIVPITAGAVEDYVIDESKKGSLTIYKYEMNDITKATGKGTGETSDASNVPSDAKLFEGVTFTATRIAGLDAKYFEGEGTALPTPSEAKNMPAIGDPISVKTNKDGVAKFSDLPLGVYFVSETKAPNHVMKKTPDFVLSIPLTDVESKRWIYDVTVYPKNETKYSDLTIHKSDYKDDQSLSNAEFKLEVKNESNQWETVKNNLVTDANGNVTVKDLPVNNYYQITETKAPSLYILDKTNDKRQVYIDTQGRVCNENKVPYNLNNDGTLFEFTKNSKPEIDKFIDKSKGKNTNLVKETTFGHRSENDRNYYTIIVTTPNVDLSKLSVFSVTDQINDTLQSPKVESVREENTKEIARGSTGYTAVVTKDNHVTVNFSTAANTVIKKNTKYYISISCFHSLTTEPILNHAQLDYTKVTGTNETEKITTDNTRTITAAYEFLKTDQNGNPLSGAVFSLFRSEDDAKNNRNPISVTTKEGEDYSTTFKTGNNGKARFIYVEFGDDVDNGSAEYWLAEIQAPEGYNLLSKPVKIKIDRNSGSYSNTQLRVENTPTPPLPKTGGYFTLTYIIVGMGMLSAAAATLYFRRKKEDERTA